MATQTEASHNPGARSSGKRAIPLAAKVARELGVVPTWPNLQTIRLAIESEARLHAVTHQEVTAMLIRAGAQFSPRPQFRPASDWEKRTIDRLNTVDRFWFEDARWRWKAAYAEFVEGLKAVERNAC